jgi:Xaa-Pro dipeptidase
MTGDVVPITVEERKARVEKARGLMVEHGIDALLLEAGPGLRYFTGVDWWRDERLLAAVIPARGEIAYVCPAFERERLLEMVTLGDDVRPWEEDENPYALVAGILRDRGLASGTLGIEESVRFFVYDGVRRQAPQVETVSADPVTIPCRSIKSAAEIALMQRANEITVAAYQACLPLLRAGMAPKEFQELAAAAYRALGVRGGIGCQFGKSTAFPHGSREPHLLAEGDVVLMDSVCSVEGYHSDISRTIVYGEPTARQRQIWALEKEAQAAAFAAAQVGVPCEAVDAAARGVITAAGFGPDYRVPGLPHRTGHGIGLEVHEWQHLVRGNVTPIAPGMCFTNEPMIAIYGEFGVRIEDCMYITEEGPVFFTTPSPAIDVPFALARGATYQGTGQDEGREKNAP